MTDEAPNNSNAGELKKLEELRQKGGISAADFAIKRNQMLGIVPLRYFPEPEKKPFPRGLWVPPVLFGIIGAVIVAVISVSYDYEVNYWELLGLGLFMSFSWCVLFWILFYAMVG